MYASYNFDRPENDSQNYYFYKNGFNEDELALIEQSVAEVPFETATTVGGEVSDVRSSSIKWLHQNGPGDWWWLYEKLSNYIMEANNNLWRFELESMPEAIQYTEYYASKKGKYDWHQDIGPGMLSKRKVSVTVQLSDAEAYEGGDLEYWQGGKDPITAHRGAGSVFIFPSYMMHRVTTVTKGTRKSFVLWVGGTHYR